MTGALRIIQIETDTIRRDYLCVRVLIENIGVRPLGPGTIIAKQVLLDGSLRSVEFFNSVSLSPGDKTKISQLLSGLIKDIEFKSYREKDGEVIPVYGFVRRYSLSRALTEAAESLVHDVLVPIYHAVTGRVQEVKATNERTRVARVWDPQKSSALRDRPRKGT